MSELQASPIDYPLDFPIKVMGKNAPGFAQIVAGIVRRHAPDFDPSAIEMRTSRENNYLSITCVVRAHSREQLDALYAELSGHPAVVMVL